MPRPVHFEIPADDPARAERFYGSVFDWTFEQWDGPMPYWLIRTGEGPGIDGGMLPRQEPGGTVNTIDVPSCDAYLARVERAGGSVVMPKMPVPGVGWLAYCRDTEGNTFGIMQADEAAG